MAERTEIRPAKFGPPPHPPRDGDKLQARQRVNVLVRTGRLARPNSLPCADCGHIGADRAHQYDHHLGYAAAHHLDVEAVCASCHGRRALARGEINIDNLKRAAAARSARRRSHCDAGHAMERCADGGWRCMECRRAYWRARGAARKES